MPRIRLFHSKQFFVFNLVLVGIIAGFAIALMTFSCSTRIPSAVTAHAQEATAPVGSADIALPSFRSVAAKVLPVVVEIDVVDIVKQPVPDASQGWPWDFLFPQSPGQDQAPGQGNAPKTQEYRQEGLGSGVVVRRNGDTVYILTNNHVVGDASDINVILYDKRQFRAKLVGKDPRLDLALISFTSPDKNIPIADLGDSDKTEVGDWVLAVGNPFGFMSTVTAGIVSAKGREGVGPSNTVAQFIQTDAAINRGNSGGALVNTSGEVIGINSWIASPAGGSIGLGFAIAINDAKRAIGDFVDRGSVQYGWLGVSVQDPYPSLADQMGLTGLKGSMVYHVFVDSPADKGGLRPGDFVTSINGKKIDDTNELIRIVGALPAGEDATFEIIRTKQASTVKVRIGLRQSQTEIDKNRNLWPGIVVVPIDDQVRTQLSLPSSASGLVVVDVVDQTPAAVAGIQQGDLIKSINNAVIGNPVDFYKAINGGGKNFSFQLNRQGNIITIGMSR